jgi:DNA-binding CsgD family transcriptional regulator
LKSVAGTVAATRKTPMVGRMDELEHVLSTLGGPDPAAFLIAGSAGVGKTRLAAEVRDALERQGYATAHVVATKAASAIPFGAFAPLLPEIDAGGGDLLSLLRHASDAIVGRVQRDRRLLLVVDDAHLLDNGSATLVHQLTRSASCSALLSVRTPGTAPDAVTALWKDGLAERIQLDPLGESEVRELATDLLGGPVTSTLARRLWEATSGNPLYVRELLVGAQESDSLRNERGVWVLERPFHAPGRLADLLAAKLADLPPETGEVLDIVAVGEPVAFSLVEALTDPEALEEAERLGLIVTANRGGRLETSFSHPLYGDVRRQHMPRARLRRVCQRLASALQEAGLGRHDDALRLARWQLEAGLEGDPDLLERAARYARQRFDPLLASQLARAALGAGGSVSAGLILGEAEFQAGRHAEAEQILATLVDRCSSDEERAQVANARAYNLGILIGDQAAADRVLDEALSAMEVSEHRHRLLSRRAIGHLYTGKLSLALAEAQPLIDSGDSEASHRGSYVASLALASLGRGEEAVAVAYRGIDEHRRSGDDKQLPESQLLGAVLGHAATGNLKAAEADAETGRRACLEAGDKDGLGSFTLLRGWMLLEQGLMPSASSMFREGAAIHRELRDPAPIRWCVAGLALSEAMAGDVAGAQSAGRELDELPEHWMSFFDADLIDRSRAWVKGAAGELTGARDALVRAAERAAAGGYLAAEARLLHDVVRLGEARAPRVRLDELAGIVGGQLTDAFALHAAALAEDSPSQLEEAASSFEEIGALLLAAEASCEAAEAFRRAGRTRQATARAARAAELVAECGGARTPALIVGGPVERLTRREREVVELAASGMSSREIADRLFVSVRTVDSHLLRAYSKLGVTGRSDLREAVRRL